MQKDKWEFIGVYGQRRTAESVAYLHRKRGEKIRIRYNQGNHIVERLTNDKSNN